jgi:hypothetical protein
MKKVALFLSVILVTACGSSESSKSTTLTGGLFVTGNSEAQTPVLLPLNSQNQRPEVKATSGGFVLLTFSNFLKGDTVEQVSLDPKTKVVTGFSSISGIISVTGATPTKILYRPDGGYVPPPDTLATDFPKPAISIQFGALPKDTVVTVSLNDGLVLGLDGSKVSGGSVSFKVVE